MIFNEFIKKRPVKLAVGLIGLIFGIIWNIYDWGTGDGSFQGSHFSIIASGLCGIGVYFLVDLKYNDYKISSLYAILSPLVFGLLINGYSYLYIIPQIEKEGNMTNGVIIQVYDKPWGITNHSRGVFYRYIAIDRTYIKSEFSDDLDVGDSIKIRYYKMNPNFHLANIKK